MKHLLTISLIALSTFLMGQDKKTAQVDIKTSTVCDMCVKTIEENLIYEKGVKSVSVDLASSRIHVEYTAKKTDPDAIRQAVTKLGYYADDLPGDPEAFKKLPDCCQKEGCGQPEKKE
ncbi:MAG TPA: heavy metal-associated domain-containing protein [Flavobacteriales bacterium]|jgi:mercuric ion binding protein|nr:heavy-metal-associated domain-containing protein [Flavobacteriales bacterium]MBP9176391.1 heavy-metal-associated domain-containing protein [Flavobacteriales bacterium]HQW04671.1 heavy metal-associated domain-containing protein [Flavobacteriales bacterium]HQW97707.1 heavy metal-associated domain-containing protein [Flavobacteriales bacterium]HQX99496.1 heavy metal-associated domain-containing protein [Flavobacteriales bacterium]